MVTFLLSMSENLILILFLRALNKVFSLKSILLFVILYSLMTVVTYFYIETIYLRMIINIGVHIIFMCSIFNLSYKEAIYITLVRAASQMSLELLVYIINLVIYDLTSYSFPKNELIFINYLIITIVIILIRKNKFIERVSLFKNNVNLKHISSIIILTLLQIILVCLTFFDNTINSILVLLTIIFMSSILFSIYRLIKFQNERVMKDLEGVYSDNLEQLFYSIRSQRHDYMNHFHVIAHLVHRKSYKEVATYLEELNTHLDIDHSLLRLNHPSLVALLQAKREHAKRYKINLTFDIKTSVPTISLKSYELIQVVANIVDNAFDEEILSQHLNKEINISVDTLYNSFFVISVNNLNSLIKVEETQRIFLEGYSTKANHKGIGLFTVNNLLSIHNAYIDVNSNKETGTTFYIFIPSL